MLKIKKQKTVQDKSKYRQNIKNSKKPKQTSPVKQPRNTPEKKRTKKDENMPTNKTYTNEFNKSKDKQHIQLQKKQLQKQRYLNTSPIDFDHDLSGRKKSRSKSNTKISTYRSQHTDRDKENLKSVSRKLYQHVRETSHHKSPSKSKSRSRLHTCRDVSPALRPTTSPIPRHNISPAPRPSASPLPKSTSKGFNVADRQIKYSRSRTQSTQLKKKIKQKVKGNKLKEEMMIFNIPQVQNQPKVKLRKKVPQIKTQFSERRKSFFDQNLLKSFAMGQEKTTQLFPFVHVQSSSIKDYNVQNASNDSLLRQRQLESFKREQQLKLMKMLTKLQSLKGQTNVIQQIDVLIGELNQHYYSLQDRGQQLSKNQQYSLKQPQIQKKIESNYIDFNRKQSLEQKNQKNQHQNIDQILQNLSDTFHPQIVIQKPVVSYQDFILFPETTVQPNKELEANSETQLKNDIKASNERVSVTLQIDFDKNLSKRSHSICLNQLFGEKISIKQDFSDFKKVGKADILRNEFLQQLEQQKQSDSNILKELNFQPSSDTIAGHNNPKQQLIAQLDQIGDDFRVQQRIATGFQTEIHPDFEISSRHQDQSDQMLLGQGQIAQKKQLLVSEVLKSLLFEFGSTILRSKTMLHNFLSSFYNQSDEIVFDNDPRSQPLNCNNLYVTQIVQKLIVFVGDKHKAQLMRQLATPYSHNMLQTIAYIRCQSEQGYQLPAWAQDCQEAGIVLDYSKIQQFETQILRNQYFVPGLISFNYCIYDAFNEAIDELRPFGSEGKPINSISIANPIKTLKEAQEKIMQSIVKQMGFHYQDQKLPCFPKELDQVFQLMFIFSVEVAEQVIEEEVMNLFELYWKRSPQ